jgi:acyl-coenzyme A synthetase/AMP-(fatty) acid ligase/aryl carrier-like protein
VPSAGALRQVIRRHGVTTAFLTTALLNALVDDDPAALAGLAALLFGGEAVSVDHVLRLQRACPEVELIHCYGPTETTTFATTFPIRGPVDPAWRTIPIGRPIAHTTVHVLDPEGRAAAPGEVGEAYIGGDGVALGYRGRPEVTAARFLPDASRDEPLARLYRSGDLVRVTPTGDIEFVGRRDHQVKLRGHRIELGEIEAQLEADPDVKAAVVTCREDRPGDKRLVAYLVAQAPGGLDTDAVRQRLRAALPSVMVPAHWCVLDRLPLNANGKLDRGALPAPAPEAPSGDRARSVPARPVERALAGMWRELLHAGDPGLEDDFFDAGGDSLLALRLLARVRQQHGVDLSVAAFFQDPTLAAMAARVEALLYLREGERRADDDQGREVLWF